jgi:hypothetical protein
MKHWKERIPNNSLNVGSGLAIIFWDGVMPTIQSFSLYLSSLAETTNYPGSKTSKA